MNFSSAQAVLMGLSLGDALGFPVKLLSLGQIYQIYPNGITEITIFAPTSDNSRMVYALLEGILEAGLSNTTDKMMPIIKKHLNELTDSEAIEKGDFSILVSSAVLGYLYQHDENKLKQLASETVKLTHHQTAAIASSIAIAYLVKLALDGVHPQDYLAKVWEFCSGISVDFDMTIRKIGHVLGWGSEIHAMRHLGTGHTVEELLTLALYSVMKYPDDYVAAIRRAVNTEGNSDTIASIAGAIMGARLGLDAIPENWQRYCENRKYILKLAEQMFKERASYAG